MSAEPAAARALREQAIDKLAGETSRQASTCAAMAKLIRTQSATRSDRPDRTPDHRPSPIRYSTIRPGMLTPVVSMLFRNSIV